MMPGSALGLLDAFRGELYRCLTARADALFSEMASGVLMREGAGLTLSAVRRRARACVLARGHGRKDKGCLASRSLGQFPLAGGWHAAPAPG